MNLRPIKPKDKDKAPSRWSYHQRSEDFINWVNTLGIERTYVGRLAHIIDRKYRLKRVALVTIFFLLLSFLIHWDSGYDLGHFKEPYIV